MELLTNSSFDYEVRDGNITSMISFGEKLLFSTDTNLLIELKLILDENSVIWKREREFKTKDVITNLAVDEKLKIIFFKEANSKGIYLLDYENFEVMLNFYDEKMQFKNFKYGVINVGSDIVNFSLDESFFSHRIAFQSKDNILFIYQYGDRERTPKMKKITEQVFKRRCDYIFLCRNFLVLHFEGKTKIHLFKILENGTLEDVRIKKEDKTIIPDVKHHVPQLFYLASEGGISHCLMRCGKKVFPIALGEIDGNVIQYDGVFQYKYKRFSTKPLTPIAFSFPYVAGISNKPNIQIEFKNLMNHTKNPKDCTAHPPLIKDTKEFCFIAAGKECFYVSNQNQIIPIFFPTFEYMRDLFYRENIDHFVPLLEITKNKVDYDIMGKKYSIIHGSLMNMKFSTTFGVLKEMKKDKQYKDYFDLRIFLNKFPRFEDSQTITDQCILPEELNPLRYENVKLITEEFRCEEKLRHSFVVKAEDYLLEFLEEARLFENNSLEQKAIDYCLLALYLLRIDDNQLIYEKTIKLLKTPQFLNYSDELFVKLVKFVKYNRVKGIFHGVIGNNVASLKFLYELYSKDDMLKDQHESKSNILEDMVDLLSKTDDYDLVMKYAPILMKDNETVSLSIFTTKRNNISFHPKKIQKFLQQYSSSSLDYYSFYLISQENHKGAFFIDKFVKFIISEHKEGKDISKYRKTLNEILITVSLEQGIIDLIMKSDFHLEKSLILKNKDQFQESFKVLIQSNDYGKIEEMINEMYDKNPKLTCDLVTEHVLVSKNPELFHFGVHFIRTRNISIVDMIKNLERSFCESILHLFFTNFNNTLLTSFHSSCSICSQTKECYKCKQCNHYDLCYQCYSKNSQSHYKEFPTHYFIFTESEKVKKMEERKKYDEIHHSQISKFHEQKKKQRIKLKMEQNHPFLSPNVPISVAPLPSPVPQSLLPPSESSLLKSFTNRKSAGNQTHRLNVERKEILSSSPSETKSPSPSESKFLNFFGKFLANRQSKGDESQDDSKKRHSYDVKDLKSVMRSEDYIPIQTKKQAPLNRQFTNHKINFHSVFFEEDMKKGFMDHLKIENNQNPFQFLLRVYKLENKTTKETIDEFYDICEMYIKENSENSINISGKVRSKILQVMKEGKIRWNEKDTPLEVLSGAKNIIITDLKFDSFPRFIYSDAGYDIISKNVSNTNIISTSPTYAILYKLQESFYSEKLKDDELKEFALDLSDPSRLRLKYLNTQWTETIKQQKRIRKSIITKKDEHEIPLIDSLVSTIHQKQLSKNVKIKIVLLDKNCSSGTNRLKKGAGRFLSPILYHMNQEYDEEGCISALMIGPWLFQWDESNLCVPKKCVHTATLLSADVKSIYSLQNLDDSLEKLASVITKWNITKNYKIGGDKESYGNSQDFVEDILRNIGVKLVVPKPLETCLKTIQEKGFTNFEFVMGNEFKRKFGIKETSITFQTHLQLDEFVQKIKLLDQNLEQNFSDEYEFLKSFDRTFWMKYYGSKDTNLEQSSVPHHDCPFQDPVKTHSFIL